MNLIHARNVKTDFLVLSINTFDNNVYCVIKDHENFNNLAIKVKNLKKDIRHKLHLFERKNEIIIFSVGAIKDDKRDMIFQLSDKYIKYIFENCTNTTKEQKILELIDTEFSKFKVLLFSKVNEII